MHIVNRADSEKATRIMIRGGRILSGSGSGSGSGSIDVQFGARTLISRSCSEHQTPHSTNAAHEGIQTYGDVDVDEDGGLRRGGRKEDNGGRKEGEAEGE